MTIDYSLCESRTRSMEEVREVFEVIRDDDQSYTLWVNLCTVLAVVKFWLLKRLYAMLSARSSVVRIEARLSAHQRTRTGQLKSRICKEAPQLGWGAFVWRERDYGPVPGLISLIGYDRDVVFRRFLRLPRLPGLLVLLGLLRFFEILSIATQYSVALWCRDIVRQKQQTSAH
jgi:hypothetical protein